MTLPSIVRPMAGLAAVLLAAGCGTTLTASGSNQLSTGVANAGSDNGLSVPSAGSGLGGGPAGTGNSGGGATSSLGVTGGSTIGSTSGSGAGGGGGAVGGSSTSGNQPGPKRQGTTAGGTLGPGVSAKYIYLGVEDDSGNDKRLAAAGIKGTSVGSEAARAKAIIGYINAHGGVAGRQLKPVVYDYNVNNTDAAGERNKECKYFTNDNHIFAFMGGSPYDDYRQCLANAGASMVGDLDNFDGTTLRQFPATFPAVGMSVTREMNAEIDQLAAMGFFSGKHKIGLVYGEQSPYDRNVATVQAALARHGLQLADQPFGVSLTDTATAARDTQAAEFRFSTDHIDRVLFDANQPLLPGEFMIAASTQHYYPSYGLGSWDDPTVLESNVPDKKQLSNVWAVGWQPFLSDVDHLPAYSASAQQCLAIYKKAGVTAGSQAEVDDQLYDCDIYFFFAAAARLAGPSLNVQTFARGVSQAAPQLRPRTTFLVDYRNHPDGISGIRWIRWQGNCGCFAYTSGTRTIP